MQQAKMEFGCSLHIITCRCEGRNQHKDTVESEPQVYSAVHRIFSEVQFIQTTFQLSFFTLGNEAVKAKFFHNDPEAVSPQTRFDMKQSDSPAIS